MDLSEKLAHERRGRLAAERLLELKQVQLFDANDRLGQHALQLSDQIIEKREEAEHLREEAEHLKGENTQVRSDLDTAEQRLWNSIQTIQDGFAVFDNTQRMVTANDNFIQIFDGLDEVQPGVSYGRLVELLVEEGAIDIGKKHPSEWQTQMLERWLSTAPADITIKLWNQRFIKVIDRRAPNGDTVTLAHDITDTIRYEHKLKEARDRSETANRAKSSFLANMSHELRTPMNGVVGMADLLQDSDLDDEQQLYVDTIKGSGEALLVIINDVLDYSKVEAGKLQLTLEPFDLFQTLDEICTLLRPTATDKGLALDFQWEDDLARQFIADPGRIRQIMINLLGNAIKFTLEGQVVLRVAGVETSDPENMLIRIEIEDTGIGIPKNQLEHIFGEFNQAEDEHSRSFDGTGLGLAITRELVHLMGGDIWVDSIVDEGSCFGLKIPLPRVPEEPSNNRIIAGLHGPNATRPQKPDFQTVHIPTESLSTSNEAIAAVDVPVMQPDVAPDDIPISDEPITTEAAPRMMRVLAAEDNKTNRLVFSKMIKALNIDLKFAENGIEAVEYFQAFNPDMIFMDISMPKMDGKQATAEIRRLEIEADTSPVPIVAVTAHAMDGDSDSIFAAGVTHYLTKPLKKALIIERIHDAKPEECADLDGIE
ncbi:ATP-binding protein [Halocynthiibacter namhaensis]|uniref:ATP-binding protein n=1 Tax=Halocynthiibacter namhaensis TaxID=1290553 RepID=UPI000578EFD9|nr:ATP-binding protein [Halocynthiibacter namhaensis]